MGSSLTAIYDDMAEEAHEEMIRKRKEFINDLSLELNNQINNDSFKDFEYLIKNKKKILRNKKLIDLLGWEMDFVNPNMSINNLDVSLCVRLCIDIHR